MLHHCSSPCPLRSASPNQSFSSAACTLWISFHICLTHQYSDCVKMIMKKQKHRNKLHGRHKTAPHTHAIVQYLEVEINKTDWDWTTQGQQLLTEKTLSPSSLNISKMSNGWQCNNTVSCNSNPLHSSPNPQLSKTRRKKTSLNKLQHWFKDSVFQVVFVLVKGSALLVVSL